MGILNAFFIGLGMLFTFLFVASLIMKGIGSIFAPITNWLKEVSTSAKKEWIKEHSTKSTNTNTNHMETITFTRGKCDLCGDVFLGTTQDTDTEKPLVGVTVDTDDGSEKKIVCCQKCLKELMTKYCKTNNSGNVNFSKNAEVLKHLLRQTDNTN